MLKSILEQCCQIYILTTCWLKHHLVISVDTFWSNSRWHFGYKKVNILHDILLPSQMKMFSSQLNHSIYQRIYYQIRTNTYNLFRNQLVIKVKCSFVACKLITYSSSSKLFYVFFIKEKNKTSKRLFVFPDRKRISSRCCLQKYTKKIFRTSWLKINCNICDVACWFFDW